MGRGYKFDLDETAKVKLLKKMFSKAYGFELNEEDELNIEELKRIEQSKLVEKENMKLVKDPKTREQIKRAAIKAAKEAIVSGASSEDVLNAAKQAIRDFFFNFKTGGEGKGKDNDIKVKNAILTHDTIGDKFSTEFTINDYPDVTRKKVSSRAFLNQIMEIISCQITVRGHHCPPGTKGVYGQKKLHLFIEGDRKTDVMNAMYEIKRICEQSAMNTLY